ncbi:uncharacterized protein LJ206_009939 [Theristicus caerulescens]
MGPGGPTVIRVPFQMDDVDKWKEAVKGYREDSSGVAKRFEWIIKNLDPDWKDVDLMLDAMTETEKQLVLKAARAHVETQIEGRVLQGTVEDHVPSRDPGWDPNDPAQYRLLQRYRTWIKFGIEHAIPKAVNWSALYAIKQGQTETPTEFLDRLRAAVRRFTTMELESEAATQQLVSLFLGQSTNDIRKKLQKLREPNIRNLEKLLEEA